MIPGASLFLYLLPLAAAPIVFHLLMRRQRRRIMFSTKMFFDRVHPQLTFHRKVRDMLLLAARVLLIALLLLALSRLVVTGITGVSGLGGKQVVVVILDNSASMAGLVKGSEQTKLKTAVAGARALLATMDQGAKSGVVPLVADPEVEQWGGITADRNLQLNSLDKVRVTAAAGDPAKALMQAVAMLKDAGAAGGGSVHIFTDLQETPHLLSPGDFGGDGPAQRLSGAGEDFVAAHPPAAAVSSGIAASQ
ncbi:MAG: VWA domain-containing protein [Verrucomicrobia bacterium]|nr:VWA domain-containing protein [Verrucomicrobiota bacterium]